MKRYWRLILIVAALLVLSLLLSRFVFGGSYFARP
jgi:hypothetical protein